MPEPAKLIWLTGLLAVGAALSPMPWSLGLAGLAVLAAAIGARILTSCIRTAEKRARELDAQLLQSQKMAAIGEIAAGIAHEINNPLAVITQEGEWLEHVLSGEAQDMSEARSSLSAMQAQVSRCADITRNLLNLARAWKPIRQPTDLNRCVEDMVRLVERGAGSGKVTFERVYDQSLPTIPLDPPLFRQAALNLLVNAAQAAADGGRVTISTGREGDKVRLSVADDGPGIAPEHLARVFDPFFTTKAPGKGTGLGLSITQRIVDRLGGLISAANRPGGGAVFTIELPLKAQETEN